MRGELLGVLGGVGPAATVNFLDTLLAVTPAERDQGHIPTIVYNDPTVPDRTDAIYWTDEVLDHLVANASALDTMEVTHLVIASNLTHHWFDDIEAVVDADMLHMIALACEELGTTDIETVGLLTTSTARDVELYEPYLGDITPVYPDSMGDMMDAIYQFKAGNEREAEARMHGVAHEIVGEVDALVLGCTEFSAMDWDVSCPVIDPVEVTARKCVELLY